jgi:transporter family-2 protein
MLGALFSLLAGVLISLQSIFNTRAGDKIGLWETATFVHATGFIFALAIMLMFGNGSLKKLGEVDKLYLLGGIFGVIIIFSVIKGISLLGVTFSVSILLITQLIAATIIDTFGLFGSPQIKFDFTKPLGVFIMIIGIIIFKLKG